MKNLRIKACALLLGFGIAVGHAEIVITADQETTAKIADVASLTFEGDFQSGNLVVNYTDGTTAKVPISTISQVTFKEDEQEEDAIESVSTAPVVAVRGDILLITTEGGKAALYDTAGRQISITALEKGTTPLSLSSLPAGIYVININGHAVKFQKK